jgi:prolipoprotein diacylglyceryltransferase
VDPVIFSLENPDPLLTVCFFFIAFTIGYYLFMYFFKREQVPLKILDPLLYTLIIGTLVGARWGIACFTNRFITWPIP